MSAFLKGFQSFPFVLRTAPVKQPRQFDRSIVNEFAMSCRRRIEYNGLTDKAVFKCESNRRHIRDQTRMFVLFDAASKFCLTFCSEAAPGSSF